MKIGVLVSGGLGLDTLEKINESYQVNCVFTDRNSLEIVSFCEANQLPIFIGNPRGSKGLVFAKDFELEVLISVNYLFLIEEDLINYPSITTFNLHGSLLPKYRGRTPHVWAIINNEKETGITAHQINKGCDTGGVIEQLKITINPDDTGADILEKYKENYFPLVKRVLDKIEHQNLVVVEQNNAEATYFGKRTPDDGEINWNWTKERINNWVRAQASPYPGAYFYHKDEKVIIDKIKFSSFGYDYADINGKVLAITPKVLIKTPNGVVSLETIRNKENTFFE